MLQAILNNPFTSIVALLHFVCSSATLLGMIPPPYGVVAGAVCNVLITAGFLGAADGKTVTE